MSSQYPGQGGQPNPNNLPQYRVPNNPPQAQPQQPQPQQPFYPQPMPSQQQTSGGSRAGLIIVAVLAVIFVAGGIGTAIYFLSGSVTDFVGKVTGSATTTSVQAPQSSAAAATRAPKTVTPTSAANQAVNLPVDAVPVNENAMRNDPPGSYLNLYKSGPTSDEFAHSVHNAYLQRYSTPPERMHTVDAYSPVTGRIYTMHCQKRGQMVHCQGGNDANVYFQ